eukprot:CAMPEP_0194199528 /NCGR_PEP_ID=MMETSP0156-20130528/517_1 /TAXON_ID=33649 /ORGANISM="Thalassionema nitzschioides, Strain L26-B" /LENGTH=59 /DNA_ID=CAMNT_0038924437 /DNA_START=92 /DNA_END=268 /DNA_ORIENTATION=+
MPSKHAQNLKEELQNDASPAVIESLLNDHPESTFERDDDGRLPIYYACLNGASREVIQL